MTRISKLRWLIASCIAAMMAAVILLGRLTPPEQKSELQLYGTYQVLQYLAVGCEDYEKSHGTWPLSLEQLRLFRPDLDEAATNSYTRKITLVRYNPSLGYGALIGFAHDAREGGKRLLDRPIEIRFPSAANAEWNKHEGESRRAPWNKTPE